MSLSIRSKLFLMSLVLLLTMGIISTIVLEVHLRPWLEQRLETQLTTWAHTTQLMLEKASDPAHYNASVRSLGKIMDAHISVTTLQGQLVADSRWPQSQWPEKQIELQNGPVAQKIRHAKSPNSPQLISVSHNNQLTLALRFGQPHAKYIMRVTSNLNKIHAPLRTLHTFLALALLAGLLAAMGMSAWATHMGTRGMTALAQRARKLSHNQTTADHPSPHQNEMVTLANSLGTLSDGVNQALARVDKQRAQLQAVLEGMDDAVLAIDKDQKITLHNRAAVSVFALPNNAIGKAMIEVTRQPKLHDIVSQVTSTLVAQSIELKLDTQQEQTFQIRITPEPASGGVVLVLHDISELRQLEQVRRDFVANVSHELRTPLSVIRANSDTLLGGALNQPKQAAHFISAILRHCQRLEDLVEQLLELATIEASRTALELSPINLQPLLHTTLEDMRPRATSKKQELHAELSAVPYVYAHQESLHQILFNLLENAIKYTPEGGQITFKSHLDPDNPQHLYIEIHDNGPGVPQHLRARIFERFFRTDPSRSREQGGAGLGLAIVRHLAEAMHCKVGMRPSQPHGSIFYLQLRVHQS